jgi:hypothetical protein
MLTRTFTDAIRSQQVLAPSLASHPANGFGETHSSRSIRYYPAVFTPTIIKAFDTRGGIEVYIPSVFQQIKHIFLVRRSQAAF